MELEENNRLLVKAQDELIRTAKLADLGVLAAGVAHEINNPMAIIRGNTELLQMAIPAGNPDREEVDTIAQQVGRVERIVSNLLRFAHQEHKKLGQVRLHHILDDIMKQIGHQVPLTGIGVVRHYTDELPAVEGDHEQLRQVFTNLILNAIQAMEEGGELTLATSLLPNRQGIEITVTDSGAGITPENREKIFSPFFTTKPRGTGLGLSVSYGIIKDHGGKIVVESEPGQGTTFRVQLPVAQTVEEKG
jgi:two-component system NtrC family sensor kinase